MSIFRVHSQFDVYIYLSVITSTDCPHLLISSLYFAFTLRLHLEFIHCLAFYVYICVIVIASTFTFRVHIRLTCFLLYFSAFDSSSSSRGLLLPSTGTSCSKNSQRHCTGRTSSELSLDSTSSASHGMAWDVPCKKSSHCASVRTPSSINLAHHEIFKSVVC